MIDKELAPHLNNAVFVEGGVRTIKRYKRLLLRRIKWQEPKDETEKVDEEMSDEDDTILKQSLDFNCSLIWEGIAQHPSFGRFQTIYDIKSDMQARAIFTEAKQEHCWNSLINF